MEQFQKSGYDATEHALTKINIENCFYYKEIPQFRARVTFWETLPLKVFKNVTAWCHYIEKQSGVSGLQYIYVVFIHPAAGC